MGPPLRSRHFGYFFSSSLKEDLKGRQKRREGGQGGGRGGGQSVHAVVGVTSV